MTEPSDSAARCPQSRMPSPDQPYGPSSPYLPPGSRWSSPAGRRPDLTGRAERSVRRPGPTDGPPPGTRTVPGRPPATPAGDSGAADDPLLTTPLPGHDAYASRSAARVAGAARRVRRGPALGNCGRWPFTCFRRRDRSRSSGPVGSAITELGDLTPHAETSVDAAGPGRQASRTCPPHRNTAADDVGAGSVPSATARDREHGAHGTPARSRCRNRGSSTPGAGHCDALSLPPDHSPPAFGWAAAHDVRAPGTGDVCLPLTPGMPSAPAQTHRSFV
jgi:hypothetical protein